MILLTTSDYFPRLGGLSTFTQNIEKVLMDLGCEYKLFHWKNYKEIEELDVVDLSSYQLIINIHPQFAWLSKSNHEKMINFIPYKTRLYNPILIIIIFTLYVN